MPLNVPDNNEDVTDLENQNNPVTVGAYSVPLNGAPKVRFIQIISFTWFDDLRVQKCRMKFKNQAIQEVQCTR